MIEAVIFDMDGVLIDSEPFWRESHRAVLAKYGYTITSEEVRASAGKRTLDVAANWRKKFGFAEPNDQALADEIVDGVIEAIRAHGRPMAGVTRLTSQLAKHDMPMAVASSSSMRLIDVVLASLQIKDYMQAVHSGEHEANGKPFPDVFLSTAKTLQVDPQHCLVFEDSLNGVKAAKAAGMHCYAVPELPYDAVSFAAAGADRILPSLEAVSWPDIASI